MRRELLSLEAFEEAVGEEIEISSDFGLPMRAFVLYLPSIPDPELIRRLLDNVRLSDLAAITAACELALVLPNASREAARTAGERLLCTAPRGSVLRAAGHEPGDTPATLLDRARHGEAI